MVARYYSSCVKCNRAINQGDCITNFILTPPGKWGHSSCLVRPEKTPAPSHGGGLAPGFIPSHEADARPEGAVPSRPPNKVTPEKAPPRFATPHSPTTPMPASATPTRKVRNPYAKDCSPNAVPRTTTPTRKVRNPYAKRDSPNAVAQPTDNIDFGIDDDEFNKAMDEFNRSQTQTPSTSTSSDVTPTPVPRAPPIPTPATTPSKTKTNDDTLDTNPSTENNPTPKPKNKTRIESDKKEVGCNGLPTVQF